MKVAEALVKVVDAEGAPYVFGLPGTTIIPFLEALRESNIRFISSLNENVSVGIADGYSRATLQPSFVFLHAAPGLLAALPNLYNALLDRVPVVIIVGGVDSRIEFDEPAHWLDDLRGVVGHLVRWSWRVSNATDVVRAVRRALKVATSPEGGPTCIIVPEDIAVMEVAYEQLPPHTYRLSSVLRGDREQIMRAAELLLKAKNPVVIAGWGVAKADAVEELVALSELLCIPVFSESAVPFTQSVTFPHDHPLYMGVFEPNNPIIQSSDVILAVGCRMLMRRKYTSSPLIPPAATIIHIHSEQWEVAKSYPIGAGIVSDARSALSELTEIVKSSLSKDAARISKERCNKVAAIKEEERTSYEDLMKEGWDEEPIKPWRLVKEMERVLGSDTVLVDDGITTSTYLPRYYKFTKAGTLIGRSPGSLGWGGPAALGVKLARPNKKVVALLGDGTFLFAIQSLWTAAKYDIPVVHVVCNNRVYASVKAPWFLYAGKAVGEYVGCDLKKPVVDFVRLCEGFGVRCISVSKPDEVAPALAEALDSDKPIVVDVHLDSRIAGLGMPRLPG